MDQIGKFLVISKSRNYHLMILYNYDTNTILEALIPDRKNPTLQKAFLILFHQIKQKGYSPTIMYLDNKVLYNYLQLLEDLHLKV